jgi:hypothetical protein
LNVAARRAVVNYHSIQFDLGPFADPPGDFDWSGWTDGEDLLAWQRGYGSTTSLLADADGNGIVNGADHSIWKGGFGQRPTFTTPTPEPESLALMASAVGIAWAHRRRSPTSPVAVLRWRISVN